MPIFGTTYLSFIPCWSEEGGLYAIQKTVEYGFDMLEMCLPASLKFDAKTVKKQLHDHRISGRLTLNIPADCHMPLYPEKATELIKAAIDKVAEMDGDFLGGVLHSAIGKFTGNPCTQDRTQSLFSKYSPNWQFMPENEISQ